MDPNSLPQWPEQPQSSQPDAGKGRGLFSSKPKAQGPDLGNVLDGINTAMVRLRILEERYTNLRRKIQLIEQNMISSSKKSTSELKLMNEDISEVKHEIMEVKEVARKVVLELQNFAQKTDLEMIKKYVNLWEPLNFVTRSEVEKIVNDLLEQKLEKA